jgi:hypothetical protein
LAGLAFIIGGSVSLAMTLSIQGELDPLEDLSPYGIGWILAGIVMISVGLVLKTKKSE